MRELIILEGLHEIRPSAIEIPNGQLVSYLRHTAGIPPNLEHQRFLGFAVGRIDKQEYFGLSPHDEKMIYTGMHSIALIRCLGRDLTCKTR